MSQNLFFATILVDVMWILRSVGSYILGILLFNTDICDLFFNDTSSDIAMKRLLMNAANTPMN